jgi:organic radical activating enzyme
MNILLTEQCNKNCEFCLVAGRRDNGRTMTLDAFQYCLEFARASAVTDIYLLGGEPTIHPRFRTMVEMAYEHGMRVTLLTNLLFGADTASQLAQWSAKELVADVLVNSDFPDAYSPSQRRRFLSNLCKSTDCPSRITLAITLREPRPIEKFRYLRDYYRRFDISRCRVSLDVRRLADSVGNKELGSHYYNVVRYLCEQGFAVSAELCAVPRCLFTDYQDRYLRAHCANYHQLSGCAPNLDVFPDLSIGYCAARPATSVFRRPMANFRSLQHAREYYCSLRDMLCQQIAPGCETCSSALRSQCRLNCLSRFDELPAPEAGPSVSFVAPDDVAVLPLLGGWHIFRSVSGVTSSYVVDDWAMAMLNGVWAGRTLRAVAEQIAKDTGAAEEEVQTDLVELLDSLAGIAEARLMTTAVCENAERL